MNNEDEILSKFMKEDAGYIMDDGFTQSVMKTLPRGRMSPSRRRTVLVIGAATLGCSISAFLISPDLPSICASASDALTHYSESLFSSDYALYILMAWSLVLSLGAYVYAKFADSRREGLF